MSPGLQRSPSLLGMSIAQRRAWMAGQIAESAFSGVGAIAQETRRVQSVAEAAVAKAHSIRGEVESKVAELTHHAKASVFKRQTSCPVKFNKWWFKQVLKCRALLRK